MNQSVILMEEDHANINRALGVIRSICLQLMQGGEVPDEVPVTMESTERKAAR